MTGSPCDRDDIRPDELCAERDRLVALGGDGLRGLAAGLLSRRPRVASFCLDALAALGARAHPALADLLGHADPAARANAAHVLARQLAALPPDGKTLYEPADLAQMFVPLVKA